MTKKYIAIAEYCPKSPYGATWDHILHRVVNREAELNLHGQDGYMDRTPMRKPIAAKSKGKGTVYGFLRSVFTI